MFLFAGVSEWSSMMIYHHYFFFLDDFFFLVATEDVCSLVSAAEGVGSLEECVCMGRVRLSLIRSACRITLPRVYVHEYDVTYTYIYIGTFPRMTLHDPS